MKETKLFYIFENNNKFSKNKFSLNQAKFYAKTLENCFNMVDCRYCIDSNDLINSSFCENCSFSVDLKEEQNIDNNFKKNINDYDKYDFEGVL